MATAKETIMSRMTNMLKGQATYVREDESLSIQDKCIQLDVILDTMRFLNDYEENVKVLNKHLAEKRKQEKWKGDER